MLPTVPPLPMWLAVELLPLRRQHYCWSLATHWHTSYDEAWKLADAHGQQGEETGARQQRALSIFARLPAVRKISTIGPTEVSARCDILAEEMTTTELWAIMQGQPLPLADLSATPIGVARSRTCGISDAHTGAVLQHVHGEPEANWASGHEHDELQLGALLVNQDVHSMDRPASARPAIDPQLAAGVTSSGELSRQSGRPVAVGGSAGSHPMQLADASQALVIRGTGRRESQLESPVGQRELSTAELHQGMVDQTQLEALVSDIGQETLPPVSATTAYVPCRGKPAMAILDTDGSDQGDTERDTGSEEEEQAPDREDAATATAENSERAASPSVGNSKVANPFQAYHPSATFSQEEMNLLHPQQWDRVRKGWQQQFVPDGLSDGSANLVEKVLEPPSRYADAMLVTDPPSVQAWKKSVGQECNKEGKACMWDEIVDALRLSTGSCQTDMQRLAILLRAHFGPPTVRDGGHEEEVLKQLVTRFPRGVLSDTSKTSARHLLRVNLAIAIAVGLGDKNSFNGTRNPKELQEALQLIDTAAERRTTLPTGRGLVQELTDSNDTEASAWFQLISYQLWGAHASGHWLVDTDVLRRELGQALQEASSLIKCSVTSGLSPYVPRPVVADGMVYESVFHRFATWACRYFGVVVPDNFVRLKALAYSVLLKEGGQSATLATSLLLFDDILKHVNALAKQMDGATHDFGWSRDSSGRMKHPEDSPGYTFMLSSMLKAARVDPLYCARLLALTVNTACRLDVRDRSHDPWSSQWFAELCQDAALVLRSEYRTLHGYQGLVRLAKLHNMVSGNADEMCDRIAHRVVVLCEAEAVARKRCLPFRYLSPTNSGPRFKIPPTPATIIKLVSGFLKERQKTCVWVPGTCFDRANMIGIRRTNLEEPGTSTGVVAPFRIPVVRKPSAGGKDPKRKGSSDQKERDRDRKRKKR